MGSGETNYKENETS